MSDNTTSSSTDSLSAPREVVPGVHLIDLLFQGQPGTIGAYLLTGPGRQAALIETGPATTVTALLDGVRAADVDPASIIDVLVTHIHLDHAGGAGVLLRDALPNARVLVHPIGHPHLIDPVKLIRSATRLYGDKMETLWGEIAPIPSSRAIALTDGARLRLAGHDIEVLFTPGHAAHHVAIRHLATGAVFAGDAAGVRVPGAGVINPPTVPPEFDLKAWETTIERLLVLGASQLLLAHFGPYDDATFHLEELRRRLRAWVAFVRDGLATGRSGEEMARDLQQRDVDTPGANPDGVRRLDLIAGYGISVAGIARYLEKSGQAKQ